MGFRAGLGVLNRRKIFGPARNRTSNHSTHSLTTATTELSIILRGSTNRIQILFTYMQFTWFSNPPPKMNLKNVILFNVPLFVNKICLVHSSTGNAGRKYNRIKSCFISLSNVAFKDSLNLNTGVDY